MYSLDSQFLIPQLKIVSCWVGQSSVHINFLQPFYQVLASTRFLKRELYSTFYNCPTSRTNDKSYINLRFFFQVLGKHCPKLLKKVSLRLIILPVCVIFIVFIHLKIICNILAVMVIVGCFACSISFHVSFFVTCFHVSCLFSCFRFLFFVYIFVFQLLTSLCDLRGTHQFPYVNQLDRAVGMAVQKMGPRY